ncbi:ShlB/FhaC/HecB family hemolysin secretion/activation protein [Massilia sp. W12]|uniref:ShlB/FhaC/HecB family hemolysin secretion/activation protein n=1 Tax=Massilia sp. W12 TaxID=3126507 RepID=UPI0030CA92CB
MRQHPIRIGILLAISALPFHAALAQQAPVKSATTGLEAPPIIRFDISSFAVSGNTLLPEDVVQAAVAPYTGRSRDFGDVQRALEALEKIYHQRGFNTVQVELPEQELNQGVVKLRVVQMRIGKVTVDGNSVFATENIRRSVPGLKEGETPNIKQVSASLRMANENPAKKVTLQLESGDKDEEVNALLKVADERPWKLGASLANTGSKSSGKTHLGLTMQHANLWGLDHVGSLQYTTTTEHPSRVGVYGLGYHIPLYNLGDSLDIFASYSDVDSGLIAFGTNVAGSPTGMLAVSGKGRVFGLRYNQSLARRGDWEPRLSYGLDYKAFINNVSLGEYQLGEDVTIHPLSISLSANRTLSSGELSLGATLLKNIPGGKNGRDSDLQAVRAGANPRFTILRLNANYSRSLAKDWQFRFSANAQYTRDVLIPGEQFGAGGATSVRGFAERELSNDYGMQVNTEVYSPNICTSAGGAAMQCRLVFFHDLAYLARNQTQPGEQGHATISSLGLGWRVLLGRSLSAQMDVGRVIDDGKIAGKSKHMMHFKINLSY